MMEEDKSYEKKTSFQPHNCEVELCNMFCFQAQRQIVRDEHDTDINSL